MKKLIDRLFAKPEDDPFVTMMQAALDTPEMRQQLVDVLSLPRAERQSTIKLWLADLKSQQAPALLIDALTFLDDEQRADRALEILTN